MSQYRDHLDAAQARIETLEAKLKERDAALAARDAELAEMRAEVARLRGGNDDGPFDGESGRAGQRAFLVALAVCGLATAAGYAMVRPFHCALRRPAVGPAVMATAVPPSYVADAVEPREPVDVATIEPLMARTRVGSAVSSAIEEARRRVRVCRQLGGPRGPGEVTVTFHPVGTTMVELTDPSYAGTAAGECIERVYGAARVAPYDGEPITVTAGFSL